MWDLFDFNNDGKVSLEEKIISIQLLEGTYYDNNTPEDIAKAIMTINKEAGGIDIDTKK